MVTFDKSNGYDSIIFNEKAYFKTKLPNSRAVFENNSKNAWKSQCNFERKLIFCLQYSDTVIDDFLIKVPKKIGDER